MNEQLTLGEARGRVTLINAKAAEKRALQKGPVTDPNPPSAIERRGK